MPEDPRSYFRIEARELIDGLAQGAMRLERAGTWSAADRKHLLRLAHTLKGAARIVKESAIAEAAHQIEDLLAGAGDTPDPQLAGRVLAQLDALSRLLPAEPSAPPESSAAAASSIDEQTRSVRVDLAAIDGLLNRTIQIGAACADIRDRLAGDQTAADRRMVAALDGLAADVAQLRDDVRRMRLAPAAALFVTLERALRDAAQAAGVRARLVTAGGDQRLDADVLGTVRDALIQLVRNAVAHGIEPPAARLAAGKPPEGTVTLSVERRGAAVAFVCRDDGRGLDLEALRQAAGASGAVPPAAARHLSERQIIDLLLAGGMTSRDTASEFAGRGVGLDLVRATAARLDGRLSLANAPGRGLAAELVVPVSVRSLLALRLQAAGQSAFLPVHSVRGALRLAAATVTQADGRRQVILDGRPLDIVRLASILPAATPEHDVERLAVLVGEGEPALALAADHLGEVEAVVVQALPSLSGASPVVRGVAVDERGGIVPVLEPAELPGFADAPAAEARVAPEARTPRVLVIDDSITTRMLEQSILEAAGYQVDTAVSAEDALVRASRVPYDLFIVDVEMPGMNGFDFLEQARQTAGLAGVPAILVTSRASAEDRQRGADAGARAYIVKSEFDQDLFLRTIRGLLG